MANYYASTRTNYFRVKDEEEFRKFMAHVSGTEDRVELWEEKDNNDNMEFRESNGICRFCGSPLFPSDVEEYTYQCFQCDEDFYSIEQSPVSNSLNAEVNG